MKLLTDAYNPEYVDIDPLGRFTITRNGSIILINTTLHLRSIVLQVNLLPQVANLDIIQICCIKSCIFFYDNFNQYVCER